MKKEIIIMYIVSLFSLSCEKENDAPSPFFFNGTTTALVNGEYWSSSTRFILSDSVVCNLDGSVTPLAFYISAQDSSSHIWKLLEIGDIKPIWEKQSALELKKDQYKTDLQFTPPLFLTTADGDVLSSVYELDTTSNSDFVQITTYDTGREEVHGVFKLSFIKVRNGVEDPDAPDRIEFTEGKFVAKAPEEWFQWDKKCDPK